MIVLIVLAIIAVLAAVAVFAVKTFRIDVTHSLEEIENSSGESEPGEEDGESAGPETVDLIDYFGANEEEAQSDEDMPASRKEPEDPIPSTAIDRLTEFVMGRRYLHECARILEAANEEGLIYCAVCFDYDRFRYINSLKGANTGDYVLTQTAQQIARVFPEGAQLSRISADHFCAVFPLVDIAFFADYYDQLKRICEKIRADINSKSVLKLCVGFSTTESDSCYDVNVLLTRANIARHCVKVTKAEKFEIFEENMVASNYYGDALMENYSECQYGDEFVIYFEKMVDLMSDRVVGCDVLARWTYSDSSETRITQDTGHLPSNNDKVIYQACRAMSRLRKASRAIVTVFVDMTAIELFKTDVDEFVATCLQEFQIEPSQLAVKVEAATIRVDWSASSKQIKKLKDIGVNICITGIDTGYTKLDFLNGLSVDYVKLHQGFVHGIEKNPEQTGRCRHMLERIQELGAKAIFEGVNNVEAASALRKLNAKTVQGRFAGYPPSTVDDLIRELPEYIERKLSEATVILDEKQLSLGEWKV